MHRHPRQPTPAAQRCAAQLPTSGGVELHVATTAFSHTADGSIRIVIDGDIADLPNGQTIMLSVASSHEQTTAVELMPDDDGNWQVIFTMPDSVTNVPHSASGQALFVEFRTLPTGQQNR